MAVYVPLEPPPMMQTSLMITSSGANKAESRPVSLDIPLVLAMVEVREVQRKDAVSEQHLFSFYEGTLVPRPDYLLYYDS